MILTKTSETDVQSITECWSYNTDKDIRNRLTKIMFSLNRASPFLSVETRLSLRKKVKQKQRLSLFKTIATNMHNTPTTLDWDLNWEECYFAK